MRKSPVFVGALAILTAAGCSDHPMTTEADPAVGVSSGGTPTVPAARSVVPSTGTIGPGAQYAFYVPAGWNGTLVLYAHGFIDPELPVGLPTSDGIEGFRDELLDRGFAIGYSSFASNGFAVKDGAQRTEQLRGLFVSQFGPPDRVLLTGHSVGGLVNIELIESHPEHYAGALVMCGLVGGSKAEVDYVGNLRVLFDLFYPGLLPGSVDDVPEGVDLNADVIAPVVSALSTDPSGALAITQIDQTPVPFSSGPELAESFVRGLGFLIRGEVDVRSRSHGHFPYGNVETTYTGALPAATLTYVNANVQRIAADRDALNAVEQQYEPTGALTRPVLTLHNALDPVAPYFHEELYREKVEAAGASELLVQRTSATPYGHCALPVPEMVTAFQDLVSWVDTGVRP